MMRKQKTGAVIIEFALTFPLLLITFVFAWQVLNSFTYDVLGSYAAFASARSYSVFRNYDFDGSEEGSAAVGDDANVARAVWLARDVAAAVMSPYSKPAPGESYAGVTLAFDSDEGFDVVDTMLQSINEQLSDLDPDAVIDEGEEVVEQIQQEGFWNAMKQMVTKVATDLIQDIVMDLIVEYVSYAVSEGMNDVLGAPGVDRYATLMASICDLPKEWCLTAVSRFDNTFEVTEYGEDMLRVWRFTDESDSNIATAVDVQPRAFEKYDINLREQYRYADKAGGGSVPMRVARVSFTYHYPMWIGFAQHRYMDPDRTSQYPAWITLPIYNACAAPLEPGVIPSKGEDPIEMEPMDEGLLDELKRRERLLNTELQALYLNIHDVAEKMAAKIDREHWDIGTMDWSSGRGATAKPPGATISVKVTDESAHLILRHDETALDAFKKIYGTPTEGHESGVETAAIGYTTGDVPLIDIIKVCKDEYDYRMEVIVWIDEEVEDREGEIEDLDEEIDELEEEIDDLQDSDEDGDNDDAIDDCQEEIAELEDEIDVIEAEIRIWKERKRVETVTANEDRAAWHEKALKIKSVCEALKLYYEQNRIIKNESNSYLVDITDVMTP